MNAFERWLLKHRPYCEIGSCMIPSTRIAKHNRRNTAFCDAHYRAFFPVEAGLEARSKLYSETPLTIDQSTRKGQATQ